MTSPDKLARRVVRTEEDVKAISDTVSETLTRVQAIQRKQREHDVSFINVRGKVERLESSVAAVQQVQHEQSQVLAEHSDQLASIQQQVTTGFAAVDARFTAFDERFTTIEQRVSEGFAEILRHLDAR